MDDTIAHRRMQIPMVQSVCFESSVSVQFCDCMLEILKRREVQHRHTEEAKNHLHTVIKYACLCPRL